MFPDQHLCRPAHVQFGYHFSERAELADSLFIVIALTLPFSRTISSSRPRSLSAVSAAKSTSGRSFPHMAICAQLQRENPWRLVKSVFRVRFSKSLGSVARVSAMSAAADAQ